MSGRDLREVADARLGEALEREGVQDPRPGSREMLRRLRAADESGYREAVGCFERRVVPAVAAGETEPLHVWLEYGRRLAVRITAGEAVQIDPTGRRLPLEGPVPAGHLVLHLPAAVGQRAIPLRVPRDPSPAQRATLDLLVGRDSA